MMCIARNRNRMSVDGSIRSDYVQRNNYTPTRSRVRDYQRPPSHYKKNSMVRKSNIFEYIDETK